MSLPTLQKTWQFNVNNLMTAGGGVGGGTNAAAQAILLFLKNNLLAFALGAPTIGYSGNGVTVGSPNDGVDHWSTTADIRLGIAGAAHSWFVFKQPGIASGFQYLLSAEQTGAISGGFAIALIVSPSAGFTGGTTTARPTATDEVVVLLTPNPSGFCGGGGTSGSASLRLHLMQSTDGACMRFIICASSVAAGMIIIDAAANTVAGWSPAFVAFGGGNTGTFPTTANMQNAVLSLETLANGSPKSRIGTTNTSCIFTAEGTSTEPCYVSSNFGTIANEIDGLWEIYPIGIVSMTAGVRGRCGAMIDLWWGSRGAGTGDTYDLTSKTFAQFGDLIFPWNGTAPLIA